MNILQSRLARWVAPLGVVAATVLATAAPAGAATGTASMESALRNVSAGHATSADLAFIRQHPDIADKIPAPGGPVLTKVLTTPKLLGPPSQMPIPSWPYEAQYTQYSTLGNVMYTWHVHYALNGLPWAGITNWEETTDWLTDVSSVVVIGDLTANAHSAVPSSTGWAIRSRHLQYCVLTYCYANTYPHSRLDVSEGLSGVITGSAS
jgi:hypothetical protein